MVTIRLLSFTDHLVRRYGVPLAFTRRRWQDFQFLGWRAHRLLHVRHDGQYHHSEVDS